MEKMKMQTPDGVEMNLDRIAQLFPGCITETRDDKGIVKRAVDFDLLRQELSGDVVEGPVERYQLNWPGKRQAIAAANAPINKTLRPCEKESVNFDTTENLYIEGDNLDALKLLQETYLGKVKMIYIDPPYNTGNDFIYKDNFTADKEEYEQESGQRDEDGNRLTSMEQFKQNTESNGRYHSDWLSMMLPRLRLARNLLREDGVIFISIDDGEVENLKKMCIEVFGADNFLSVFIWEKRTSRENRKVFSVNHDYIVAVAKNRIEFQLCRGVLPYTEEVLSRYRNPDNDPRGDWQSVALSVQGGHGTTTQFYDITTPSGRVISPPSGLCWRYTKDKLEELISDNRIWFGVGGDNVPRLKLYLSEVDQGLTPHTLWMATEVGTTDSGKREVNALFEGVSVFETPKPVDLIKRFVQISNAEKSGIILDFFAGSATTAHAVMQLNAEDGGTRKFIMVQLPELCDEKSEAFKAGYKTIAEIGKERIRRAGQKIKEENATSAPNLDIGFRVLKVDSSNMKDVWYTPDQLKQHELELFTAHIKEDRTPEDLLFQIMLDWGSPTLDAKIRKEKVGGKNVFIVNDNDILACFEQGITEELVKQMAAFKPLRAVFRDDAFDDSLKINVEQIFKVLSPGTEVKSI